MHLLMHFCSLLLRELPGLVTQTLKHLSRTVWGVAGGSGAGVRSRGAVAGGAAGGGAPRARALCCEAQTRAPCRAGGAWDGGRRTW